MYDAPKRMNGPPPVTRRKAREETRIACTQDYVNRRRAIEMDRSCDCIDPPGVLFDPHAIREYQKRLKTKGEA